MTDHLGHGLMSRRACLISLCVLTTVAATAVACDHSPSAPTVLNSPPPGAPSVVRLEIDGPPTLAPGASAQFSAIEHLADGTSRRVAGPISWRSSSSVCEVTPLGLVTAIERGETVLTAAIDNRSSTREVIVLPDGTFRLTGTVTEAGVGLPIAGARLEVIASPPSPLVTFTDGGGRYRLYGVAGDIQLRVTKEGYPTHSEPVVVTG